jgi:ABC-2 type transport system permease protein
MSDVQTVAWKEWRELLRMSGSKKGAALRHLFSIAVIGVLWPWQFGLPFVNSALGVIMTAMTALMYVAGAAPDTFAGERERHTLETLLASRLSDRAILLGKIVAMIQYGCVTAAVMLVIGLLTVNIIHGKGELLLFSPTQILTALVFTPLASGLMASIGIHVSLRAKTVKQAQQTLSTAVLILLIVPAIAFPTVPQSWQTAALEFVRGPDKAMLAGGIALGMLVIQLLLFMAAAARFRRGRLIL